MTHDIPALIARLRAPISQAWPTEFRVLTHEAADALERLQAELDAATHELRLTQTGLTIAQEKLDMGSKSRNQLINEAHNMKGQRDWLAKELDAAMRDAKRYKWLADGGTYYLPYTDRWGNKAWLDSAIDAAMATATPAGEPPGPASEPSTVPPKRADLEQPPQKPRLLVSADNPLLALQGLFPPRVP